MKDTYDFSENYKQQSDHPSGGVTLSAFFCGTGESPSDGHQLIPRLFNDTHGSQREDVMSQHAPGKVSYSKKSSENGKKRAIIFPGPGAVDPIYDTPVERTPSDNPQHESPEARFRFLKNKVRNTIKTFTEQVSVVKGNVLGSGMDENIRLLLNEVMQTNFLESDPDKRVTRLNVAGWSRGSYTGTQRLPRVLYEIQQGNIETIEQYFTLHDSGSERQQDLRDIQDAFQSIEVNLLAVDTVRGPTNHYESMRKDSQADSFLYPNVRNYLQLSALQENSRGFCGEIPPPVVPNDDLNQYVIPLPGTHGQLVGSLGQRWDDTAFGVGDNISRLSQHIASDYLLSVGTPLELNHVHHEPSDDRVLRLYDEIEDGLDEIYENAAGGQYLYFASKDRLYRHGNVYRTMDAINPNILSTVGSFADVASSHDSRSMRHWLLSRESASPDSKFSLEEHLKNKRLAIEQALAQMPQDAKATKMIWDYLTSIDTENPEQLDAKLNNVLKIIMIENKKNAIVDTMHEIQQWLEDHPEIEQHEIIETLLDRGLRDVLDETDSALCNIDKTKLNLLNKKIEFISRLHEDFLSPMMMMTRLLNERSKSEFTSEDMQRLTQCLYSMNEFSTSFDIDMMSKLLSYLEPGQDIEFCQSFLDRLDDMNELAEDNDLSNLVAQVQVHFNLYKQNAERSNIPRGAFKEETKGWFSWTLDKVTTGAGNMLSIMQGISSEINPDPGPDDDDENTESVKENVRLNRFN